MSTNYSADQYDGAFKSHRLQNWCVSQLHTERPGPVQGHTKIIANDRGHLLPGVAKKGSAWPDFKGTWDLPPRVPAPSINPARLRLWSLDPRRSSDTARPQPGKEQQDPDEAAPSRPASQRPPSTAAKGRGSQSQRPQGAEEEEGDEDEDAEGAPGRGKPPPSVAGGEKDAPPTQHSEATRLGTGKTRPASGRDGVKTPAASAARAETQLAGRKDGEGTPR